MTSKHAAVTRVQSAADVIRHMILTGELGWGMRLQAQMLADQLGVSKTPVYDALAALHGEGLLDYEANRGYSVKQFDLRTVLGAFDVRLTLEGLACRLVADQGLPKAAAESLRANLKRTEDVLFGQAWTAAEQEQWRLLNLAFHDSILALADNPYLTRAVMNARSLPPIYDAAKHEAGKDNLWPLLDQTYGQQAFRDHVRIFEAIEAGQGVRAENMMKEHIFSNREKTRRVLESLISTSPPTKRRKRQ